METITIVIIGVALITIALARFVLLPKLNLSQKAGFIARAVVFGAIVLFLAYDFITKEKYLFLFVLGLGTLAFVRMLLLTKRK